MDLSQWLMDLAAGFNFELKAGLVRQYIKILSEWKLTPDQWDELNRRILLRQEFFPRISYLYETACEILRESEAKASSKALDEIWKASADGGAEPSTGG